MTRGGAGRLGDTSISESHPGAGLYDDVPIDGVGFDGELNLLEIAQVAIEAIDADQGSR